METFWYPTCGSVIELVFFPLCSGEFWTKMFKSRKTVSVERWGLKRNYYDFLIFFLTVENWDLEPRYFVRMQHYATLFSKKIPRMPKKNKKEEFFSSAEDNQYVLLKTLTWLLRNAYLTWLRLNKNWTLANTSFKMSNNHCIYSSLFQATSLAAFFFPVSHLYGWYGSEASEAWDFFAERKQDSFSTSRHWLRSESKLGHQWHMLVSLSLLPYLLSLHKFGASVSLGEEIHIA